MKQMRRIIVFLILSQICLISNSQIVANHTIVADFDKIPPYYITEVKKMMVTFVGESHSMAYRTGLELLEALYPAYQVNVTGSGTPEPYTDQHLRASGATWGDYSNSSGWIYSYGEEDWFTNSSAIAATKASITYCNTHGLTLSLIGFGWCWDMLEGDASSTIDPSYGCHWYGWSAGGPDGDRCWGLDAGDYPITGNSVSMDTYLSATEDYIAYCTANGYITKVAFTTGPVDPEITGEPAYQAYIKHQYIRNYVAADPTRILFDYADILCYDDDGTPATTTWNGHIYPCITTTNLGDANIGHIGSAGAIRLAKAQWWLLARIAGWDGVTSNIPVTGINVTGAGGSTTITTSNGTLQLSAAITPSNATNQTVTWTIANGTGQASISASGLVTASASGTVTARATANDGSGVYGTLVITISDQVVPVTGIIVTGTGGATSITTNNGTLQLSAAVSPSNATNQTVTWTIANGTGQASISTSGLVTANASGTVTARATANDGSGVYGTLLITISDQVIPVTGITVTGAGGASIITSNNGTLQLSAAITPSNATNQAVIWTIANGTGQASISASGLVTAIAIGIVTARATATDGTAVNGTIDITLNSIEPLVIVVSKDKLKVTLDESYSSCKLSLYNLLGHLINSQIVKSNLCVFNIASLHPGIYLIVLSKNIVLRVEKVIISY